MKMRLKRVDREGAVIEDKEVFKVLEFEAKEHADTKKEEREPSKKVNSGAKKNR
jgi:hypothetical protein